MEPILQNKKFTLPLIILNKIMKCMCNVFRQLNYEEATCWIYSIVEIRSLFIHFFYSTEAHASIYSDLHKLPGVYVKKIETLNGFEESYELAVVQPIDHNNPAGAKFTQRVFLSHINPANPVVFETNGYGVPWQPSFSNITIRMILMQL
jgi:hypothetical protein